MTVQPRTELFSSLIRTIMCGFSCADRDMLSEKNAASRRFGKRETESRRLATSMRENYIPLVCQKTVELLRSTAQARASGPRWFEVRRLARDQAKRRWASFAVAMGREL